MHNCYINIGLYKKKNPMWIGVHSLKGLKISKYMQCTPFVFLNVEYLKSVHMWFSWLLIVLICFFPHFENLCNISPISSSIKQYDIIFYLNALRIWGTQLRLAWSSKSVSVFHMAHLENRYSWMVVSGLIYQSGQDITSHYFSLCLWRTKNLFFFHE